MPDRMSIIAVLTRGKLFLLYMAIGQLNCRFSVIRCFCTELNAGGTIDRRVDQSYVGTIVLS